MTRPLVEDIKLRDLVGFAESNLIEGRRGGVVAISRSRARAWQHNPYADPDDSVLLVAYVGGHCAGYLGLMPGRIRIDRRDQRVDWFSTLYVPRQWRSTGVGALLLMRACALGHSLAASGLTSEGQRACSALGFESSGSVDYYVLDLSRRNLAGRPFRALRRLADEAGVSVRFLDHCIEAGGRLTKGCLMPLLSAALAPPRRVHTKTLEGLQSSAFERIVDERRPVRFLRDASVVNWMLRHPWVTTNALEDSPGYRFDDLRDAAEFRLLEIHDDHGVRGFAVLSLTTRCGLRDVRLLDHHLEDPGDVLVLPSIVLEHARRHCADRVFLPESCRALVGHSPLARQLFERRHRRTYVRPGSSSVGLSSVLPNLSLEYCDGDVSFA